MHNPLDQLSQEMRIFLLVTVALAVLAAAVTVLFFRPDQQSAAAPGYGTAGGASSLTAGLDRTAFLLPDERRIDVSGEYHLFREVSTSWSERDVREFWVDPAAVAEDYLEEKNREKVMEILGLLP